jgi:hypothetical protein
VKLGWRNVETLAADRDGHEDISLACKTGSLSSLGSNNYQLNQDLREMGTLLDGLSWVWTAATKLLQILVAGRPSLPSATGEQLQKSLQLPGLQLRDVLEEYTVQDGVDSRTTDMSESGALPSLPYVTLSNPLSENKQVFKPPLKNTGETHSQAGGRELCACWDRLKHLLLK